MNPFKRLLLSLLLLSATNTLANVTDLVINEIPGLTYQAATTNNTVLILTLQDDGSGDTLQSLTVENIETYAASEPEDLLLNGVKLWIDSDGNTTNGGTTLIGSFTVSGSDPRSWSMTGLNIPVVQGDAFIVTVDTQSDIASMRTLNFTLPSSGAVFASSSLPATDLSNSEYQLLSNLRPAYHFQASLSSDITTVIGIGQADVPLGSWLFESDPQPGHDLDADCSIQGVTVYFSDSSGPIVPSDVFSAIHVVNAEDTRVVYIDKTLQGTSSYISSNQNPVLGSLYLDLTANGITEGALTSPGYPVTLQFLADIKPSVSHNQLQLSINGPSDFIAFDFESGNTTTALASPSFPLETSQAIIQAAANTVIASFTTPPSLTQLPKGSQGLTVIQMVLRNPGSTNTGNVQLKTMHFSMVDGSGQPILPASLLSRVWLWDGVNTYLNRTVSENSGNTVTMQLSSPVNVSSASPITTYLRVDVKSNALPNQVRFQINDLVDIATWKAVQADTEVEVESFGNTPFASSLLEVVTSLQASHRSLLPSTLYQGQSGVPVMELVLNHPGPSTAGNAVLNSIRLHVQDPNGAALSSAGLLSSARLTIGTTAPAQTISFSGDAFTLALTQPITLAALSAVTLTVQADLSTTASAPSGLRFRVLDTTDLNASQPAAPGRIVVFVPLPPDAFPMSTSSAPIQSSTAEGSVTNYPNPFRAGRENTTFSYYLATASRVTLRLYTVTGLPVRTLLDQVPREPGGWTDLWDGRNGKDQVVTSGVYIAVLEFESAGISQKVRRKVAVLK